MKKKKKDDTGAYLHVRNAAVMTLVRVYPQAVVLAYTKWGEVGTKKKKKSSANTHLYTRHRGRWLCTLLSQLSRHRQALVDFLCAERLQRWCS